jgi:hypothetical protein
MLSPTRRLLAALPAVVVAVCIWLLASAILNRAPDWPVDEDGDAVGNFPCSNNLRQLYTGMSYYVTQFGNDRNVPPHRGETFWKCLTGKCTDTKLHPKSYFERAPLVGRQDLLICHYKRDNEPPETIDYRGPAEATLVELESALKTGQKSQRPLPLACEKPGHHKNQGGWVLFTDGAIRFLSGAAYADAFRRTE